MTFVVRGVGDIHEEDGEKKLTLDIGYLRINVVIDDTSMNPLSREGEESTGVMLWENEYVIGDMEKGLDFGGGKLIASEKLAGWQAEKVIEKIEETRDMGEEPQ